jgi:hypothetical protein
MDLFNQGINPTLPLAVYTKKQEDCQEFSINARVPISQELMVTKGTKYAINCGDFHHAWREWRRMPAAYQTWDDWKTPWTRALQENCDIQKITGGRGGSQGILRRETWPTNSSMAWTIWQMQWCKRMKQSKN